MNKTKLFLYLIISLLLFDTCTSQKSCGRNGSIIFKGHNDTITLIPRADLMIYSFIDEMIESGGFRGFTPIEYKGTIFENKISRIIPPFTMRLSVFVKQLDTMKLESKGLFNHANVFLDNIPFKKGYYILEKFYDLEYKIIKGAELFKDCPEIQNIIVKYLPNGHSLRDLILIKDINFFYYDLNQDSTIFKRVSDE